MLLFVYSQWQAVENKWYHNTEHSHIKTPERHDNDEYAN
jgi:hypothetical protein